MEFKDTRTLITGSTSGIGAETARLFASHGAEVLVSGRDAERGEHVVREIHDSGGSARFIHADLTDLDSIRRLATDAGSVDILVNNAAFVPMAITTDQDPSSFDLAMQSNIRAPFFLTSALLPGMIAKGAGSIVNVSSMAAKVGMPGLAVYSASKAALESLTRTWAAEFAGSGVRVNSVSPGPTGTERNRTRRDAMRPMIETTLLKRLASTTEIAEAILFLSSSRASYITGATLAVDGGRTAA
jgi:NAD(P)-dependent dehydrogenase (short-subunit alcohol dehydrogenase family)